MPRKYKKYNIKLSEIARTLGVSRQRVWQMVQRKNGRCITCGKQAETMRCPEHTKQHKAARQRREALNG